MEMRPEDLTQVRNRLRRAQGQLDAVVRMIEKGGECQQMVTQLAAVSKAIDRAGFLLIATGMRHCVAPCSEVSEAEDSSQETTSTRSKENSLDEQLTQLEKMLLSLA